LPLVIRSVRKNSTVSRIAQALVEAERFEGEASVVGAHR
jgi:hypothetical protein